MFKVVWRSSAIKRSRVFILPVGYSIKFQCSHYIESIWYVWSAHQVTGFYVMIFNGLTWSNYRLLKACNFSNKSNTPLWVFFIFFQLYKRDQMAQSVSNDVTLREKGNVQTTLSLNGTLMSTALKKVGCTSCLYFLAEK